MQMTFIEVIDLSVKFGDAEVVTGVNFRVQQGDFVGLVGPNGSGKTTLIKCILGLVPPAKGVIRLFGEDRENFCAWHRIGYVPQIYRRNHQGFPATVREIVASGLLSTKRFPKRMNDHDRREIDRVLEMLQITGIKGKKIDKLSGGQQQRVFLARALVSRPDLLFLDEPTVALDPTSRERFYELLYELNRLQRKTIVLITHDSGAIGSYAKKFMYLDRSLIFFGGFDDFCRSPEMTSYFGEHAQHLICRQHNGR
jgi:zinc transport system ATP-binding protein